MEFQGEMVKSKDILRSVLHSWRAVIWVCPLRKLWRQWVCSGWCRSRRLETRGHSREPHWLPCWGPGNAPPPTTGRLSFACGHNRLSCQQPHWDPRCKPGPRLGLMWLLWPVDYLETLHVGHLKLNYMCVQGQHWGFFIYKWVSRICRKGHPFFTEL